MVKLNEVFDAFKIDNKAYRVKILSDVTKAYLLDEDTPFLVYLIEHLVSQSPREQSVLNIISRIVDDIKDAYESEVEQLNEDKPIEEVKQEKLLIKEETEEVKQDNIEEVEEVEEVKQELWMKEEDLEEVKEEERNKPECEECIAVNGLDQNCISKCDEIKPKSNLVCPVCQRKKIHVYNDRKKYKCETCGSIFDDEKVIDEKYFKRMECYQCKKESRIELKDVNVKHIVCPKCAGVLDVANIKPGRITIVRV